MIVAGNNLAVNVGVSVLQNGGNAINAAVAVGFAMAVTYPCAGNLGGGGFMLIRFADGRSTFIDFRERAPEKAFRNMYLDAQSHVTRDSVEGWRSSGVPGTVRGFDLAHRKYGRAKWDALVTPAIRLASFGFPLTYALAESLHGSRSLARDPESKRIFLKNGAFFDVGDALVQPELARTLERIDDFTSLPGPPNSRMDRRRSLRKGVARRGRRCQNGRVHGNYHQVPCLRA